MNRIILLFLLPLVVAVGGCNDEVFVDRDLDADRECTIDGDGGSATFTIATKGLESLTIDHFSDSKGITCYNRAGEEIPEKSPFGELARINWTGTSFILDVYIDGRDIEIVSTENSSEMELEFTVRLTYDYTTRFIIVKVAPGQPGQLKRLEYTAGFEITDNYETRLASRERYTNNSSLTQEAILRPYLGMRASCTVTPAQQWARYLRVSMPLPQPDGADWTLGAPVDVEFNHTMYFYTHDQRETVTVEIPPHSDVIVSCRVPFTRVIAYGIVEYFRPMSGRVYSSKFTCVRTEPADYEITIEDATE